MSPRDAGHRRRDRLEIGPTVPSRVARRLGSKARERYPNDRDSKEMTVTMSFPIFHGILRCEQDPADRSGLTVEPERLERRRPWPFGVPR